ncbi:MAG TPA: hypothetical protein VMW73_13160, partial [Spirochaetia bacterium]|nr:hypothetical protein [Spirochaetia bacterium]
AFNPLCVIMLLAGACLAAPQNAVAQDNSLFGSVETSVTDSIAGGSSQLSSIAGLAPYGQILSGGVKAHFIERSTFDGGELYVDDTLSWLGGSDGGMLSNSLAQGYVAISPLPELTLVVGKRRISWGAGYAFFPGDLINPPASPDNRSSGFYGILATIAPSASFTLTAAVRFDTAFPALSTLTGSTSTAVGVDPSSLPFLAAYLPTIPDNPWLSLRYALYADMLFGNLDLYAATTYQYSSVLRPAAGFSLDLGGVIANGEVAVEFSNSSLYPVASSTAFEHPAFGTPYPIFTVGLQRTVTSDAGSYAITAEYLYDGMGYTAAQEGTVCGDLLQALSAISGSTSAAKLRAAYASADASSSAWFSSGSVIPAFGRHYVAVSLSASAGTAFEATAAALVNLQDGSFAVQPELRLSWQSGVELFTRAVVAWGPNDHSEFGLLPTPVTVTTGAVVHF